MLAKFISSTFFVPLIGAEIEFYDNSLSHQQITKACSDAGVKFSEILKEKGQNQWEVVFDCTPNLVKLCNNINKLKQALPSSSFSALPNASDEGNALHVHVSLFNRLQQNIFEKQQDSESEYMRYAIGGLLKNMRKDMKIFAPSKNSKERLSKGKYSPKTVSWGTNNRTVALRIPTTTLDPFNRRIEHRVASAECNPFKVIIKILQAIEMGILKKIEPESEKIYGNASLDIYNLQKLL